MRRVESILVHTLEEESTPQLPLPMPPVVLPVPETSSPTPPHTAASRPEEFTHDPHNELTPLLKRLQLGPTPPCPSASSWSAVSSWTTHPSWRSSSATRSIAAPTGAPNSGSTMPVSRKSVAWKTSTGRRQLPWIAACWTPSFPWSSWTNTSTSCWWAPLASARASSPRPWAMPPSAPDTPCVLVHVDHFFKALT